MSKHYTIINLKQVQSYEMRECETCGAEVIIPGTSRMHSNSPGVNDSLKRDGYKHKTLLPFQSWYDDTLGQEVCDACAIGG